MWSSFLCSNTPSSESGTLHNIAQYIEDYIDLVENVPNDVARHITRLHEFNNRYYQMLDKSSQVLEILAKNDFTGSNKNGTHEPKGNSSNCSDVKDKKGLRAVFTLQRCLIEIQEMADEKLYIVQSILDQLDAKARQLDHDHRSVTNGSYFASLTSNSKGGHSLPIGVNLNNDNLSNSNENSTSSNGADNSGKDGDVNESNTINNCSNIANTVNNFSSNSSTSKRSSSRRNIASKSAELNGENNHGRRGVKRGIKGHGRDVKRNRCKEAINNSPPALYEGTPIDPDEPTYCFCEQVSYGEMIGCDNTSCRIEWFHFACVSLTTKPKGKWYCPDCRGDRSNIPKK